MQASTEITHYKLDADKNVIPCSLEEWGTMFEDFKKRIVGRTQLNNGVLVSSVFLGLNHNYSDANNPHVFETMVFGGPNDGDCERCSTWQQALEIHERIVAREEGEKE